MSILLSNFVLWPLLALVAIPVLIHLFARTKPPPFLFSSLMFLRKIVRETRRVKRPQDVLLLVLRTLLFACLIAAFLRPLLFGTGAKSEGTTRTVVLIVDASASMAYSEGAQSRFATACAEGAEVLSGLTARDKADIVWLRSPPQAVFPEPGVNIPFLRDSLRKAKVSTEAGDAESALRMAADLLAKAEGRREICIISDFQKTTWRDAGAGVPDGINVVTVPVARKEAANMAISRFSAQPPAPLAGEDVTFNVEVRNFSPNPRQNTVYFESGEVRERQAVSIAAWGRASVAFRVRFKHATPASATVRLAA